MSKIIETKITRFDGGMSDSPRAPLANAGSLISFAVGAEDAAIIHKEYAEVFSQNDLVNLSNYQIAIKLMIDWESTRPFLATTLPLPASRNQNKQKVIDVSRERYARKIKEGGRPENQTGQPVETGPLYDETKSGTLPIETQETKESDRISELQSQLKKEPQSPPQKEVKKIAEVLYENPERKN